jgi:serine/threonine-protein kinase
MAATSEFYFRHILLYRELVNEDELRLCTQAQEQARSQGRPEPGLAELLVSHGLLSKSQLARTEAHIAETLERASQSDEHGIRISGFKITDVVSRSRTGILYKAYQKSLHRYVQVKVINPEFLTDKKAVLAYYTDAAAAARVNHPNIVQLIDLGFDPGGSLYLIHEAVEGETVQQMLDRSGRLPPDEAAHIVLNIARGLAYVHRIGLVHGNIRPNLLRVPPDRIAKLQDLGASRSLTESAEAGGKRRVIGNPLYMSPEQIRGAEKTDYGTDLYSLGTCFYHMVAGKPPFFGNNAAEVFEQHLNAEPEPPHFSARDCPEELSLIILKMLAKDSAGRYRDTDRLCTDLESFRRRRATQSRTGAATESRRPGPAPADPGGDPPPPPAGTPLVAVLVVTLLINAALAAFYFLKP